MGTRQYNGWACEKQDAAQAQAGHKKRQAWACPNRRRNTDKVVIWRACHAETTSQTARHDPQTTAGPERHDHSPDRPATTPARPHGTTGLVQRQPGSYTGGRPWPTRRVSAIMLGRLRRRRQYRLALRPSRQSTGLAKPGSVGLKARRWHRPAPGAAAALHRHSNP